MELTLHCPASEDTIKAEIKKFHDEIAVRQSEIDILRHAIQHYRKLCKHHPDRKSGSDAWGYSWRETCKICGASDD